MFPSEMEDISASGSSLLFPQRIKRHVKDKKTSKVNKLNTSLASKIKNKIINNSSIIKISLKHNNRALAQALSIEKENSRKLTTEKMLLHKEVEKLSFRNAFLRQKLNHLHKTLIETEAFVSSNLISAIEMTSHPEDFQSPPLSLSSQKKKGIGNQQDLLRHSFGRDIPHIRPTHLPMRVLLTSADDDEDGDDKETFHDNHFTTKKVPDSLTPVASKVSLSNEFNLELLHSPEKNVQEINAQDNPGRNFSTTNVLSTEHQSHPEESSKCSLGGELNNVQYVGQEKKKRSRSSSQSGNVTERKKRLPSWESNNFPAAILPAMDLEQKVVSNNMLNQRSTINNNSVDTDTKIQQNGCHINSQNQSESELNNNSVDTDTKIQQNGCHINSQNQSESELNGKLPTMELPRDEQQLQKTIYEADMDITAGEISKIITIETAAKNKSNHKTKASGKKAFRKVKDSSTEKNREKSKVQSKTSSSLHSEARDKVTEESSSLTLADGKSEDQTLTLESKQNTLTNMFQKTSEQNVQISQLHDKKNKARKTYVVSDEERVSLFPPISNKSYQDNNCGMGRSFQTFDKGNRRTFVVDNSKKDACFPTQKDNETVPGILENLENELQTILNCTKGSQSSSDCRTQDSLGIEKQITYVQPSKQKTTNLSRISSKYSRKDRTYELFSEINQLHENNDRVVYHKESHVEDLNSETNKPEKSTKCQVNSIKNVIEVNKKMENYNQWSDLQKLDKKNSKNSLSKPVSLLIKSKPKTLMRATDLTQHSVPLESGSKYLRELKNYSESQNEHQEGQTQSTTTTLNIKKSLNSLTAGNELHVKILNKGRESKSKKSRKTYVVDPIDQNEVGEKIPETIEERLRSCDSEQVNQEQNLGNEKMVKTKPDQSICNPVMKSSSYHLKSSAQMDDSFNTRQFSPYTTLKEDLLNSGIPIARDQKLSDNITLKESIFQVSDTEQKHAFQEKTEGTIFLVDRRTETTGKETKVLQDLRNISFVSSPKSQSTSSDDVSSILPTKRRRAAVCYKEPSLTRKLRREDESTNSDFPGPKLKKSKGRKKKEDKENPQEIF